MKSLKNNTNTNKLLNKQLINELKKKLTEKLDPNKLKRVLDIMKKVDRANYCFKTTQTDCYKDAPNFLASKQNTNTGDESVISAPVLHFHSIYHLLEKLEPGNRILDIGSGSGYLTACYGYLLNVTNNDNSKVIGLEIDSGLVRRSIKNINKKDNKLFRRNNIQIFKKNGWDGYDVYAPYDAINIAAGIKDRILTQTLWNQLKPGGFLYVPIKMSDHPYNEKLFLIKKSPFCPINCDVQDCNSIIETMFQQINSGRSQLHELSNNNCNIIPDIDVRYVPFRRQGRLNSVKKVKKRKYI